MLYIKLKLAIFYYKSPDKADPYRKNFEYYDTATEGDEVIQALDKWYKGLSKEESSANSYSAVASAKAPKSTTQNEITPSTSSYSTPAMASQPAPRSSGGSYSEGQTIDMSGFSSTNPDNLYLAYALKELNIV